MTDVPVSTLVDQVGADVVSLEPEVLALYRWDNSESSTAQTPLAVARPRDAAQVQQIVKWAGQHKVPIVPRGAGSGLSGGASGRSGAITISMERMRGIDIDPRAHTATVEPGLFNAEVKAAAAVHGLWYPPDPSSFEICSIGGNIATNAGGLCCVKYGVTTDYVLGLDVVLADGTLVRLGGPQIKDTAGLSLVKLFVGSEGTLGIVTRAILRLVPARGEPATLVATFDSVENATEAVVGIRQLIRPAMLELMDRASTSAVCDFSGADLDPDAAATLIIQSDAPEPVRSQEVALMEGICRAHSPIMMRVCSSAVEGERYAAARRAVFPALGVRGRLMYGDVGVQIPLLPRLVNGIEEIGRKRGMDVSVCAHAGDGNTHPNVVFDPHEPGAEERATAVFHEIMDLAISLGGTITGEHGVGRAKRDSLPDQLGPEVMRLTRTIKDALDPDGILNPGVMI
jgi:glycolate oxidase